jgi:hypothetical protein
MKKTLNEIKIDKDVQKEWTTQDVQMVPQKLPKKVIYNEETGETQHLGIGETKVGEETKKYMAPIQFDRDPEKISHSMTQRIEEFEEAKKEENKLQEVEPAPKEIKDSNVVGTKVVDSFVAEDDTLYTLKVRESNNSHYITVEIPKRNKSNIKIIEPNNAADLFKSMKEKSKNR